MQENELGYFLDFLHVEKESIPAMKFFWIQAQIAFHPSQIQTL